MKLIFFVVKGLEDIAANELKEHEVTIDEIKTKQVLGTFEGDLLNLSRLKTVDDIALLAATFEVNKKTVSEDILTKVESIDVSSYLPYISQVRALGTNFSVTISKYKVDVDVEVLKRDLANQLSTKLNMQFTEKEHENFDIRINIEQQNVTVSIRLFDKPLHDRSYIKHTYLGSLKSTIAASLYKLAVSRVKDRNNINLVDNFCGSGTILCEAFLQGANVSGGDMNELGVNIARDNLITVGAKDFQLKVQSAFSTEWESKQFNLAISNPPWGEQLQIASITELYEKSLAEYKRILTEDATLCFIAKKPDLLIKYIKSNFPRHKIETRNISFNGQQPTIVTAYYE